MTYTVVPQGSETRIGVDRDADGFLDRDELDVCRDPADPSSFPGGPASADIDGNGIADDADIAALVAVLLDQPMHPTHTGRSDVNCDGVANGADIGPFVVAFLGP